jgi:hypothetical protein
LYGGFNSQNALVDNILFESKHEKSRQFVFKVNKYSLRFKTKVMFGHNLRSETKGTFGEISLKLRQTNRNVAINDVNVVADELPIQSTNNLHLFNN